MTFTAAQMPGEKAAVRYLKVFAVAVVAVAALAVAVNLLAFRVMTRPENAAIVQLMDGWSRLYKPILYDATEPEVVLFGASYARDAFDPEEIGAIIGARFFNFAVSGGAAYENQRFAQSASTNGKLRAIVMPIDSFVVRPGAPKVAYGFDESVLNLTADGTPNRMVGLSRAAAITLSGAAVGNNIRLLLTLVRRSTGATKKDLLFSYERRDNTKQATHFAEARARVFPAAAPLVPEPLALPDTPRTSGLPEFDRTIDLYCDRDIDIHVYLTPQTFGTCTQPVGLRLRMLAYLQVRQAACRARLHFYDFQYPNAVTLEGVASDVPLSNYYRPDGHPRPTVGALMAPVMFRRPFPEGTPEAVRADFGTDLMTAPDPLAWWARRLSRCEGVWN